MEIERKFLLKNIPFKIDSFDKYYIEQGYISVDPVLRIRYTKKYPYIKKNDYFNIDSNNIDTNKDNIKNIENYYLTYKSKGMLSHKEINIPIDKDEYKNLSKKVSGKIIKKNRYKIPLSDIVKKDEVKVNILSLVLELDFFLNVYDSDALLILGEIEFPTEDMAKSFNMPSFFLKDVTYDKKYYNNNMI